jgi:hypothetical protein
MKNAADRTLQIAQIKPNEPINECEFISLRRTNGSTRISFVIRRTQRTRSRDEIYRISIRATAGPGFVPRARPLSACKLRGHRAWHCINAPSPDPRALDLSLALMLVRRGLSEAIHVGIGDRAIGALVYILYPVKLCMCCFKSVQGVVLYPMHPCQSGPDIDATLSSRDLSPYEAIFCPRMLF